MAENVFSDIDAHQDYDSILKAVAEEIFEGYSDETFMPDNTAIRYEPVAAAVRYMLSGEPDKEMRVDIDIEFTDM